MKGNFEVLVTRLSPTLKRITRKLNGHHSFFDDEDLYQEALIHLYTGFRQGTLSDKTDSYILQGCYFHLRNYLRKVHENANFVSLSNPIGEDGGSLEEILPAEDGHPFDYVESKMDVESVEEQYLTDRERKVLAYFMEGMSMREIGEHLGISHVMVLKIRNKIKDKYTRFFASAN